MGRPTKSRVLNVWMNGELVGAWRLPTRGEPEFAYEPGWLVSPNFRSLSLSLPANPIRPLIRGERVNAFFDNLLPDSEMIRKRVQQKFRTTGSEAFDLLAAIGRDCVGAVLLLPANESPANLATIETQPLDEDDVEKALSSVVTLPGTLGHVDADDLRISIAGAQEKTALLWHQGHWCRPLCATPTTHLFKLPLGLVGNRRADMSTSVENEWLCARTVRPKAGRMSSRRVAPGCGGLNMRLIVFS